MRFLIDTNILIPLEPAAAADVAPNTPLVMDFSRRANEAGCQVLVHPAVCHDLARDRNEPRRALRQTVLTRYPTLAHPPSDACIPAGIVGTPPEHSNDWVDNQLLAALQADAVDYLVSEDLGLLAKARRLGLETRAVTITEALGLLADFFERMPQPPPAVAALPCHALDLADPFFDTLRADYPGFNDWYRAKCCREQRSAYTIRDPGGDALAAVAILKPENISPIGEHVKTLKLSTFKVAEHMMGRKYGECLLRAVWDYAHANKYHRVYFTVHPRHSRLIAFADLFGFVRVPEWSNLAGEIALEKTMSFTPTERDTTEAFEFHRLYGPGVCKMDPACVFVVPIQPNYHRLLFPGTEEQQELFPDLRPCGNSIRKAYLCHGQTKEIPRGGTVLFYRSQDTCGITAMGVTESTCRSNDAAAVARVVGNRTVYSYREIEALCQKETLCILFRFVNLVAPLPLHQLVKTGVLRAAPQSVQRLTPDAARKLLDRLQTP